MYALHPALPAYLVAQWRLRAREGYEAEREVAQLALLQAYAALGNWLSRQIESGSAKTAYALLERQRRTMGRLVGRALEQGRYAQAQALLQPLNEYWNVRGLTQEARGWVDRCRKVTEGAGGGPPDFANAAGQLWTFMVVSEANRSLRAGALDEAEATYQLIRRNLEQSATASHKPELAVTYHQLGMVAQHRGELEQAEQWYRKSLEIEEALGDRPRLASTYHELGMVAQDRGELAQAEQWYRKSLEIEEALGNRPGLASSYHNLGAVAQDRGELEQAEQWYRKALEIRETLGDRPGLARSCCQMGLLAEARHDENLALDWMVRCVALFDQFPHTATGLGPYHLARLTAKLGMPALQSAWQRQTGKTLPPQVQAAVEQMIEELRKKQNT
jgi:tetratricopeptide (TPR) repeat protein